METKQAFEEALSQFSKGLYHKALQSFKDVTASEADPDGMFPSLAKGFVLECYKLLGIKYTSQELYKQALDTLEQAQRDFPDNRYIKFHRAIALNNSLNFPVAVQLFEAIFNAEPSFPSIRICLAIALLNLGNVERMELILRDALALPPFDATLYHLSAMGKYRRQKYSEVESLIKQSLKFKKPFPEAQINLVGCLLVLKRYEEAFRILAELLPFVKQKAPLQMPLRFLQARLQLPNDHPVLREHLTGKEATVTETAIRRWVEDRFYHTIPIDVLALPFQDSEGELIRNSWFRKLLVKHYQNMILEGVELPELYFRVGRESQRLKKHTDAMDYFRKALVKNPNFLPAKVSMAFCLKEIGKHEEALATFEEIYQDFKSLPEMVLFSAETTVAEPMLGDRTDLLRSELNILLMALNQNPHFADLYYNIGRIYSFLEDPEQALSFFDKATVLNPGFIRANIAKAVTLMQLNQTDKARDILNSLTTTNTLYAKVVYNLAVLYHQKGLQEKSRALLQELVDSGSEFASLAREVLGKIAPPAR
jgi:tetratricopeptide (TPR) repeat protein